MTVALTLNKNEVNVIERNVGQITVATGRIVVVGLNGLPVVVSEGQSLDVGGVTATILALEGSNYAAVYSEPTGTEPPDAVPPPESAAEREDLVDPTDNTSSFESKTVEELYELASAQNIKGRSKMDKDELVEALCG